MRAAALALLLSGLVAGCVQGGDAHERPPGFPVPEAIYRAAVDYAVGRVGAGYFERLYTPNETLSRRNEPMCAPGEGTCTPLARTAFWSVVFDFEVPGGEGMRTHADVPVLDDGTLAWPEGHEHDGFPECRRDVRECRFPFSRGEAVRLARGDGLEERGCPFDSSFYWAHPESGEPTFAWVVEDGPCPGEGDAEGHGRTIDANSGRIVGRGSWFLIVD